MIDPSAATIIAATLPTLAVLVGILLNQVGLGRLETRLNLEIGSLRADNARIETSLRAEIAASRAQSHAEFLLLLGRDTEIDKRITELERKSSS